MKKQLLILLVLIGFITSCKKNTDDEVKPSINNYSWTVKEYQFNPDSTMVRNTIDIRIVSTLFNEGVYTKRTQIVQPYVTLNIFGIETKMTFIDSTKYITVQSIDTPVTDAGTGYYSGWNIKWERK